MYLSRRPKSELFGLASEKFSGVDARKLTDSKTQQEWLPSIAGTRLHRYLKRWILNIMLMDANGKYALLRQKKTLGKPLGGVSTSQQLSWAAGNESGWVVWYFIFSEKQNLPEWSKHILIVCRQVPFRSPESLAMMVRETTQYRRWRPTLTQ